MNLGSKKTIIKACIIIQLISFVAYLCAFSYFMPNYDLFIQIFEYYNIDSVMFSKAFFISHFLIFVIFYNFCFIYLSKKLQQNKENFYKNIIILRIIAIILIFFDFILAILLIICAFSKDDNKDEEPQFTRRKKKKNISYDKETKKQIKKIKKEKRLGLISKELYEKKLKNITSNANKKNILTKQNDNV